MKKHVLISFIVAIAILLQSLLAPRIRLAGASPDILAVIIISLGLDYGSMMGLGTGFAGGLVLDVLFGYPVGLRTLGYCAMGYLSGMATIRSLKGILRRLAIAFIFLAMRDCITITVLFFQRVNMESGVIRMVLYSTLYSLAFMLPFQLLMKKITNIWYMERTEIRGYR